VFARSRREAGAAGAAAVWVSAVFEVAANAALVHWDLLRQDVRYTFRILGRSPGFAITAVLIVALGIGATTAAFSVTDFALIRPLPFPDAGQLVKVWERTPGYSRMELSAANYRDWKRGSTVFAGLGAYYTLAVNMVSKGEPIR